MDDSSRRTGSAGSLASLELLAYERIKESIITLAFPPQDPSMTAVLPLVVHNASTEDVNLDAISVTPTDGPFASVKEAIGGFFVLEAEDLDAAIEVASRVPAARLGGAIEIRPVETYW